jgi:hypothetical protein
MLIKANQRKIRRLKMRIGWSCVDITPSQPSLLCGQLYSRVSTHAHDPITVTALALEREKPAGADGQAIMLSIDRINVSDETLQHIRTALASRITDFDTRQLIASATHTHSAPELKEGVYLPPPGEPIMTPADYAAFFVQRCTDAAVQAWEARQRGSVTAAYGHAVVGHNRRAVYFNGRAQMYGKTSADDFDCIEGSEDHGVDLLYVWNERRELTGVVVNVACPFQLDEHSTFISASYVHEMRQELRRRFSPDLFVLTQVAAAGDQSPHLLCCKNIEKEMLRRRGLTEREELARRIANAVSDCFPTAAAEGNADIPFHHRAETLCLPVRAVTQAEYQAATEELEKLQSRSAPDYKEQSMIAVSRHRAQRIISRYREQTPDSTFAAEVHVVRLGDIAFATNPFELFLDYGLRIKTRSRAQQTFIVQLACGSGAYLPTAKAVRGGGYSAEIASNLVGPEGGRILVDRTVERINALWSE